MGKGKKGKRKDDDDWENDIEEIAIESGIDLKKEEVHIDVDKLTKKKSKKKDKASLKKDSDDEDNELDDTARTAKPSFNALMVEETIASEDDQNSSENEDPVDTEEQLKQKQDRPKNEEQTVTSNKGKKKKGKKKPDEEDLDAILADIENEVDREQTTGGKKGKKKGKKGEAVQEPKSENDKDEEIGAENEPSAVEEMEALSSQETEGTKKTEEECVINDSTSTVKTAAQKKAEKKEREKEKKKKEAKKKGEVKHETKDEVKHETKDEVEVKGKEVSAKEQETSDLQDAEATERSKDVTGSSIKEDPAAAVEGESEEDVDDVEGDKKKKKKKKKKGKDDDEKKKGKKPGKSALKQMQEALEKLKLEEERLKKEEEEKQRAFEEAERLRLEKIRLEQEKKERKKQKEKEKREKLKKEGKLLTPAQKEQKRRAEMMLAAMKQQGIDVPTKDGTEQRKKVQYVKKKKNQQLQRETSEEAPKDPAEDEKESAKECEKEHEKVSVKESEAESEIEREKEIKTGEGAVEKAAASKEVEAATEENSKEEALVDSWEDHDDEAMEPAPSKPDKPIETEKKIPTEGASEPEVSEPTKKLEEKKKSVDESDSEDEDESDEESDEESEEESSSGEEEPEKLTAERIKERARNRITKRREEAEANRSTDHLRCPVICVLGHVDTGKTKILDKIRHTNVQDGEAGGITQQIGATMVPLDAVRTQTKMIKEFLKFDLKLPGLLIIDTPGHESFSNLRTRGSSLCDMAILVVDIMHGLEPQTIESINLLRKKHTPFIVALNKIDRLFEWKRGPTSQVEDTVKKQKKNTKLEFEARTQQVIGEFAEQGLNAELFYKNADEKAYISLVPTSAHSGDGMGDLIATVCRLTQTRLAKKLAFSAEIQSTVMEVKALPGLGTTVDAILVNGKLREGDTIVTGGLDGPVVTQIRAILTPQPLKELRIKSNYIQHKELLAAQGCKITGKDLEKVMAGAPIFVAESPDEIEPLKDEVNEIVRSSLKAIRLSERGVYVQASTLGSLEALLEFLKTSKIPYSGVNIGPVHKKDVMKTSVMLEHEPLYAAVLAFDVKVERDAQELADKEGIKIFTADIIYHLFDKFTAYTEDYKEKQKDKHKSLAVFPSRLRVLPEHIFNSRDPIVIGVHIEAGSIRLGTPLTVPAKEFCDIGVITGIEANHKNMEKATAGQEVCIKIEPTGEAPRMFGRHFTQEDMIMSKISRESIDVLKNYFRDEMTKQDWQLIIEMKKIFDII